MTVRELIKELEELPQDVPVVTDYHEVKHVIYEESFYFINNVNKDGYTIEPAVILE